MNKEAVLKYLEVIKRATAKIAEAIGEEPTTEPYVDLLAQQQQQHIAARAKHVQALMSIDCWPEAVPGFLASKASTVEDHINRANAVLDMMIRRDAEHCHFLDFGCGDGWIAAEALGRGASSSTGYDVVPSPIWTKHADVVFVSEFQQLKRNHYDIVFLYDVLDHCSDPVEVMRQVREAMKDDGVIYLRCHPWTSPHASHLFKVGLNKAYIHLFLTWDELISLGFTPTFTRPEKKPMEAYRWWFHDFKVVREHIIDKPLHEFFLVPSFVELLINEQQLEGERRKGFFDDMKVEFVDVELSLR